MIQAVFGRRTISVKRRTSASASMSVLPVTYIATRTQLKRALTLLKREPASRATMAT
jgi:hypothetical protein